MLKIEHGIACVVLIVILRRCIYKDVAKAAGIAISSLYRYYSTKPKLVMAISTNSFSFRTCLASLLGLALPYFYLLAFVIFRFKSDLSPFTAHFLPLGDFIFPYDYAQVPLTHSLTYGFLVMLTVTGVVHFLRTSYNDKLRTRQLYYGFMLFNLFVFILIGLQPQHFELLMPLAIISTSPLIAHFITLTRTRITNIAFFVILIAAFALIGFNLWTSSFIS